MKSLDEIRARAEAATPGEWKVDSLSNGMPFSIGPKGEPGFVALCGEPIIKGIENRNKQRALNADFIAASRQDIPRLCEAVEYLSGILERFSYPDERAHIKLELESILRGDK